MDVRKAARFVAVKGNHANTEAKSVDILFEGADGQHYAIEIDPSIVGALLLAIQGATTTLHASLPDLADGPSQELQVTSMNLAMSPDGSLAWKLALPGGGEVHLAFSPAQFRALDDQMTEVRELLSRNLQ